MAFRRVNRRAMSLLDSLQQYRKVSEQCPNVLRAIVSTMASSFDFWTLYEALSISNCANCGRFGGYLYLITCSRACYFCFTSAWAYLPMAAHAVRRAGVSREDLERLPHLLSLPGRYTSFGKLSKKRTKLFDRQTVWNKALEAVATDEGSQRLNHTTREVKRYMAIISAPYFGAGQSVDWGVHCVGRRESTEPATHFRLKYSQDDIFDHINRCGAIQDVNGRKQHVR